MHQPGYYVTFKDRLVFLPPKGRPFYTDRNPPQDLTDLELAQIPGLPVYYAGQSTYSTKPMHAENKAHA